MDVLVGEALYAAILKITRRPGTRCAVAFWGRGAEALFVDTSARPNRALAAGELNDRDIKVVCNLKSGSTNPDVIQSLMHAGVQVLQRDDLHAKVYFGDTGAVVASANASANGLGLQGSEQAFWIEAGVGFRDPSDLTEWFDRLWNSSREIKPEDLRAARARNRDVTKNKPTLPFFDAFDPEMDPLPLLSWVRDADWELMRKQIRQQVGADDATACDLVDWGEDVGGPEDETVLLQTDWVLRWSITSRGKPWGNRAPWWARLEGRAAHKVWRYKGERKARDVVLGSEPRRDAQPFDPTAPRFCAAFREVIVQPEFEPLRALDYTGSFFTEERLGLTRRFWRDLKAAYLVAT